MHLVSESAQQVIALRRRYRDLVASNAITVAQRWGQPCHAFNVHVDVSAPAGGCLERIQDTLVDIEPTLLRCPLTSLHISVAWLLAVHVDYPESKSAIWHRHGAQWVAELAAIAQEQHAFELRYRSLVVTDTAVIAVAEPVGPVRRLREEIRRRLSLPEQTRNTADIVHTTLFRYRSLLRDPAGLIEAAEAADVDVSMPVQDLTVSEELVFPSLVTSQRARFLLGQAQVHE